MRRSCCNQHVALRRHVINASPPAVLDNKINNDVHDSNLFDSCINIILSILYYTDLSLRLKTIYSKTYRLYAFVLFYFIVLYCRLSNAATKLPKSRSTISFVLSLYYIILYYFILFYCKRASGFTCGYASLCARMIA